METKLKFTLVLGGMALMFGLATNPAHALSLTPPGDATTNDNSNCSLGCTGFPTTATGSTLLYKQDFGGGESGSFADSYSTSFSSPGGASDGPSAGTITYTTPNTNGSISCPYCYLIVKDGRQTPAQYFFDIGSWNGTDTINLSGFWLNTMGAISNVQIWGVADSNPVIPEPSTILLLGSGLAGIGLWRWKKKQ